MAIRIGRWDCTTCGHKGNLGPSTRCVNCGASRPPGVKFYLPSDADIIEDDTRLKEAKSGADWICGHCTAQNKAKDTLCYSCGNPRDVESGDRGLAQREYSTEEVPVEGMRPEEQAGEQYRRARIESTPGKPRKKIGGILGLILSSPILAGILYFLLRSFPQTIQVQTVELSWERQIQFEHFEPVEREDWQTPSGAYNVSSFKAVHHYDKVFRGYENRTRTVQEKVGEESYVCGQRDLGNGYFEDKYCTRPIYKSRQETYKEAIYDNVPVYATKYRYTIKEWVRKPEYLQKSLGTNNSPNWPEAPGINNGEWREGPREAYYYVTVLESDGDKHKEQVNEAYWSQRSVGESLQAKRSRLLDIYYGLDSLEKNP